VGRFLLVSGDFVKTGGMDRANHALASYLAARGDEVHLVAYRAAADLLGRPGVTLHRVPKPLDSYLLGEALLRRAGRRRARRVARGGGRVVVNGGNCDWGDANWVHYVHAAWAPRQDGGPARRLKGRLARRLALASERAALRRARVVVANSERTRAALVEGLGLPPGRVHTAYYGADPALFRPRTPAERAAARARLGWPADRPVVAFIGAMGDLRKGFDTLFAAWRELARDAGWDARLVVIGAGASVPAWRARAAAEGLAGSVAFLGFRADVPEVLGACDALASPTRYEAYGLNVQEALCCGLPAIVSASAGVAERYPEGLRDLLLPDPEDAADLAARLRRWRAALGRPRPALESFSAALRAHTWDDMAGRIASIIEGAA
jgi:glycosyltransferase involved in cell wall biosynthesis